MLNKKGERTVQMKRKILILLLWIFIWQLLAIIMNSPLLLPGPFQVFVTLGKLMLTADFWQVTGITLLRIGGGFFLGVLSGLLLAAFGSRFSLIRELLSPVISLFKTAPAASLVVLLLIWWGSDMLAVSICFLVVMPGVYLQTLEGIRATEQKLLQMAKVFRMPFWNRFFYIYRPALKPFLQGSLKAALGMSWKAGVAAEVIGTPDFSIGEKLYLSKIYLDTAQLFAWTAAVILLSCFFEKMIFWLVRLFFAWEPLCKKTAYQPVGAPLGCEAVSKGYGEIPVLQNFTAEYRPGQTYYLRSPSGSGKTTLLKLLCGIERPDSGRLKGGGSCSVTFQENRLCEEYSAIRNVEMAVGDRKASHAALLQLLEESDLHKPCKDLSGGMKRRVAIVRAMEAQSDTVLLDEPYTGMDAATRERVQGYIRQNQRGRILIIATHI